MVDWSKFGMQRSMWGGRNGPKIDVRENVNEWRKSTPRWRVLSRHRSSSRTSSMFSRLRWSSVDVLRLGFGMISTKPYLLFDLKRSSSILVFENLQRWHSTSCGALCRRKRQCFRQSLLRKLDHRNNRTELQYYAMSDMAIRRMV